MDHELDSSVGIGAVPLSLLGGFVGGLLGARRGKAAFLICALLGGTAGYMLGTALAGDNKSIEELTESAPEPIAIDIDNGEGDDA